jgi:hypothetical protein
MLKIRKVPKKKIARNTSLKHLVRCGGVLRKYFVNSLELMDLRNATSVLTKPFQNEQRKQAANYDDFAEINQEENGTL